MPYCSPGYIITSRRCLLGALSDCTGARSTTPSSSNGTGQPTGDVDERGGAGPAPRGAVKQSAARKRQPPCGASTTKVVSASKATRKRSIAAVVTAAALTVYSVFFVVTWATRSAVPSRSQHAKDAQEETPTKTARESRTPVFLRTGIVDGDVSAEKADDPGSNAKSGMCCVAIAVF